jgi:flagellar hook assembly protein FlgD
LDIFDVRGQLVRTLVSGTRPQGRHSIVWDGRTNLGAQVSSGIYFYRLNAAGDSETRKMTVLR